MSSRTVAANPAPNQKPSFVRNGYLVQHLPELLAEISAGTGGDAARWGGSSAVVGMTANPSGGRQAGGHIAGRSGLPRRDRSLYPERAAAKTDGG